MSDKLSMVKKVLILLFIVHFTLTSVAFALDVNEGAFCKMPKAQGAIQGLCNNVDDIICKDVPAAKRRSCNEAEHSIIHENMSASEVFSFTKSCLVAAGISFTEFFTDFLPDLCKELWKLTKEGYEIVANGKVLATMKGSLESASSVAADVYEVIRENPAGFLKNFWNQLIEAIGPMIANFDCMKPEAKVEKVCGSLTEWIMPPAIFAKVLAKGPKAAREIYEMRLRRAHLKGGMPDRSIVLDRFKAAYGTELKLKPHANEDFMEKMKADAKITPKPKIIYLDVENSVLKALNDKIFVDKKAVDAISNSFFQKLYQQLKNSPELASRLDGEYKDYKSLRLRLKLRPGDDSKKFEELFNQIYKKSNDEFALDFSKKEMSKLIPPRTDELGDVKSWFLAGAGSDPLEANMASRASRNLKERGQSVALFKSHTELLSKELSEIEQLRLGLTQNKKVMTDKIFDPLPNANAIPSKAMINIMRKVKPSDFENIGEYLAVIKKKGREQFGVDLDDATVMSLTQYFKKVDSLSPPLFSAERVLLDLGSANNGIVSVDFAGIGVDNIYQQMKALAEVDLKKSAPEASLQKAFQKMQSGVDQVSEEMNQAKKYFAHEMQKIEKSPKSQTLFSGDDGIHMPSAALTHKQKLSLVKELAASPDPSKYRVTFVSTMFDDNKLMPVAERSQRIVRAELVEKDLRAKIIGLGKISEQEGRKIITAIDYKAAPKGGEFNLIISGKDLSKKEMQLVIDSFRSVLKSADGEIVGEVIFNH